VFEVIFTELLSFMQPAFSWQVTPLQGDHGIDLRGCTELFSVPELNISAHLLVYGQCKVRSSTARANEAFSADLDKLIANALASDVEEPVLPSYLVLAFAAKATRASLASARKVLIRSHQIPLYFFGLEDIDQLIRHHLTDLTPTIKACLPFDLAVAFLQHFQGPTQQEVRLASSHVTKPNNVLAGEPFTIRVIVSSPALPTQSLCVRFVSSSAAASLIVVSPLAITSPQGIPIGGHGHFRAAVDMKLIAYGTGHSELGHLAIQPPAGPSYRIALGTVEVADTYTPPFYWKPYLRYWQLFNDWFVAAKAGAGRLIACLGSGGAGKTRLAQEFCIRCEQLGGRAISIAHHNGPGQPYRILRDLLFALAPDNGEEGIDANERVVQKLQQLDARLFKETRDSVCACLEWVQDDDLARLRTVELARALVALLIAACSEAVHVLHFSNLHWCDQATLHALRVAVTDANNYLRRRGNALLVIFEGRSGHRESSTARALKRPETDWSSAAFEAFCDATCDTLIVLRPFDEATSGGFLTSLLEHSQSALRRVKLSMIPHQDALAREVLRAARGNPQHMIEQLNLLRLKGIVARNERTGLLYLVRQPQGEYAPPPSVLQLLQTRLDYFEVASPEVTRLIQAVGLVEDRIDRRLFDRLRAHFAPRASRELIEETEFLLLSEDTQAEVAFRHENYFRTVKARPLDAANCSAAAAIYLSHLKSFPKATASTLLFRARVILSDPERPAEAARNDLRDAYRLADRRGEDQIALRVLTIMDGLPADCRATSSEALQRFKLRKRLAELTLMVGDRSRASQIVTAALDDLEGASASLTRRTTKASPNMVHLHSLLAGRLLLADAKLNLFEARDAIAILEESLAALTVWGDLGQRRWAARLGLALRNRLAVAQAISGDRATAAATALLGVNAAREFGDRRYLYAALLDYGNIVGAVDLPRGLAALHEALAIVKRGRYRPQQRLLGEIHLALLQLVSSNRLPTLAQRAAAFAVLQQKLTSVYLEARLHGLLQETGAAALLVGDIAVLLDDPSAGEWFLQTISWSFRGRHFENLWRGHINLAQFCVDGREKSIEEALHHAEHTLRLLREVGPLRPLTANTRFRVALAQVVRVFAEGRDARAEALLMEVPELRSQVHRDGKKARIALRDRGLDFVNVGSGAYFLY
jgi:hypothetical protein